jgi:hypothetical protein
MFGWDGQIFVAFVQVLLFHVWLQWKIAGKEG